MFKVLASSCLLGLTITLPAFAQFPRQIEYLNLSYPPNKHKTQAEQIFLIGSAPAEGQIQINDQTIERSPMGHFAPSVPLAPGSNEFVITYQSPSGALERKSLSVTRIAAEETIPTMLTAPFPKIDLARQPQEPICFQVQAPAGATVSASVGRETFTLSPQTSVVLPSNAAVLTLDNEAPVAKFTGVYSACRLFDSVGDLGPARYSMTLAGVSEMIASEGAIEILDPQNPETVVVQSHAGVARTGPSTSYARLTPLPQTTQAQITGKEGDWLRLDYGGWIRASETQLLPGAIPPKSMIRSLRSETLEDATRILFPLQVPVPVTIAQNDDTFSLTLHNAIAQTDTIYLSQNPIIRRLDWAQVGAETIRYDFRLTSDQQWGYDLYYEGNNLILTFRHPPEIGQNSLTGTTIWLDPGHGGTELGAVGPTGYPEKDINLTISQKIQRALEVRGAKVVLSRSDDRNISLGDRQKMIQALKPTLALSVHYNALPDAGDAENTAGIGMFWYHSQAHDLAQFLHDDLTARLNRPSYGVFWNNLALTRPHAAPSVLMEFGFMINPKEFEWITDPEAQDELAAAIADSIATWLQSQQ